MSTDIANQLSQRYELDARCYRTRTDLTQAEDELRLAKHLLHQKKDVLLNYESGIRGLVDRLWGTRTEKLEMLNLAVRQAEEAVLLKKREREILSQTLKELEASAAAIPTTEVLRERADAVELKLWARLETDLCTEMLEPLLAKVLMALEGYDEKLRGGRMGELQSTEEAFAIETDHISLAKESAALLERLAGALEILEQPLEIPVYFLSPAAFIDGVAAKHNRLDRMGQAQEQVRCMQKRLQAKK